MAKQEQVNQFYKDFWAKYADDDPRKPNANEALRARAITGWIESRLNPQTSKKILDLGCGRGWLTQILSRYGSVAGVEPVESAVQLAKELFPDLDFRCGDVDEVIAESERGTFDLVVASEVIEHVPAADQKTWMKSLAVPLKSGGSAILTTPRGELRDAWMKQYGQAAQPVEDWVTENHLQDLCRSSGFDVMDRSRIFSPEFCYDSLSRLTISKKARRYVFSFPLFKALLKRLEYRCSLFQIVFLQKKKNHFQDSE